MAGRPSRLYSRLGTILPPTASKYTAPNPPTSTFCGLNPPCTAHRCSADLRIHWAAGQHCAMSTGRNTQGRGAARSTTASPAAVSAEVRRPRGARRVWCPQRCGHQLKLLIMQLLDPVKSCVPLPACQLGPATACCSASPTPSHCSFSSGSLVNLIVLLMKICNSSNINYQRQWRQQQQLWNKSSLFLIIHLTLLPATAQFSRA